MRKERNSQFSLRSFARLLDISPAQLSQVLSGKRVLTSKMASHIASKLSLSPLETESLLDSLNDEKKEIRQKILSNNDKTLLQEDEFRIISDWYHFAILSLAELRENSSDARWISKRLNISIDVACNARDRLVKIGFIKIVSGKMILLTPPIITGNDYVSESIRRSHKQNLNLALEKIDTIDVENREFTTITMPTNIKKIKKAKKMMRDFKRQLAALLESGKKTEVYTLALQLFPVSDLEEDVE